MELLEFQIQSELLSEGNFANLLKYRLLTMVTRNHVCYKITFSIRMTTFVPRFNPQVILATSEHLLKINIKKEKPKSSRGKACKHGVAALFMARFKPKPGSKITNSDSPVPSFHWEFVKAFILKCTQHEILQMKPYIKAYLTLFVKHSHQIFGFWYFIRMMCMVAKANGNLMLVQWSRDNNINRTHVNPPPFGVVVDSSHAGTGTTFENLRAKTLEKFEDLIPKLRGRRL